MIEKTMIPKKIHYCWFGGNPKSELLLKCIKSWEKYCPDYEIIEWNEQNYDVNKITYTRQAYKEGKYAFVSDYARLDIIYQYGGIYLDTDVELIKPIEDLLNCESYFACELPGEVNTGLGFGSISRNPFIKENMKIYEDTEYYSLKKTCVAITTDLLTEQGLKYINKIQVINGILIYPPSYFCPVNMLTNKINIKEETLTIHHYGRNWGGEKKIIDLGRIKLGVHLLLDKIFGYGTYRNILKAVKK